MKELSIKLFKIKIPGNYGRERALWKTSIWSDGDPTGRSFGTYQHPKNQVFKYTSLVLLFRELICEN